MHITTDLEPDVPDIAVQRVRGAATCITITLALCMAGRMYTTSDVGSVRLERQPLREA